jgi:hypothetical protein
MVNPWGMDISRIPANHSRRSDSNHSRRSDSSHSRQSGFNISNKLGFNHSPSLRTNRNHKMDIDQACHSVARNSEEGTMSVERCLE